MTERGAADTASAQERRRPAWASRLIVFVPLLAFAVLAALFFFRLGSGDPSRIPSALIGRHAPALDLPALPGIERNGVSVPGFDAQSLKGEVMVLNVWASWCVPCRDEAPLLMQLATDSRIRLIGMNYKDQPENARRFLSQYGNPYFANGVDANGRAGIEWGVYGVPETFVINRGGIVVYKLIGPITSDNLERELRPAIEKALAAPTPSS